MCLANLAKFDGVGVISVEEIEKRVGDHGIVNTHLTQRLPR